MSSRLLWNTVLTLDCGCVTRIEQVGYSTYLPGPGDEWTCQSHGDTEVEKSSRVSK